MSKNVIIKKIVVMIVVSLCAVTHAVDSNWTNGSTDQSWDNVLNWDAGGLPTVNRVTIIEMGGADVQTNPDTAILDNTMAAANPRHLYVGKAAGTTGSLFINGGDMDSEFDFTLGNVAGATGYFDMTGGTLIVGRHALWGNSGSGYLTFSGGLTTIDHNSNNGNPEYYLGKNAGAIGEVTMSSTAIMNISDKQLVIGSAGTGKFTVSGTATLNVAADILLGTAPDGDGTLIVDGGTVVCERLDADGAGVAYVVVSDGVIDAESVEASITGVVDVTYDGTLRVDGHVTANIQAMEADGAVVAYGGRGSLVITEVSDPNKHTEMTTAPIAPEALEFAYNFKPAGNSVAQDSDLTWSSGDNSVSSHIYFGTDAVLVAARDGSTDKGIQTSPYDVVAGDLVLGQTYYWAVDEFDGAVTSPSDVISFTVVNYVTIGSGCVGASYAGVETATQLRSGVFDFSNPALKLLSIDLSGENSNDIVPMTLALSEPGAAAPNGGSGWAAEWNGSIAIIQNDPNVWSYPAGMDLTVSPTRVDGKAGAGFSTRPFTPDVGTTTYISFLAQREAGGSGMLELYRDSGHNRLGVAINADGSVSARNAQASHDTTDPGLFADDGTVYLVVVKGTSATIYVKLYGMSDVISEPVSPDWDVEFARGTGVLHDYLEMTTDGLSLDELRIGTTFAGVTTAAGTTQVVDGFDYPLPVNTLGVSAGIPVAVAINDTSGSMTNPNASGLSVALVDFVNGGIDLSNVATVDLGFGAGGSGAVEVCNVAVYTSRCLAGLANANRADTNDDCRIDLEDHATVAADFGMTGQQVVAVDPGSSGLRIHYKFDEVSGTTAADETGSYDGTLSSEIWDNSYPRDGSGYVTFDGASSIIVSDAATAFATVDDEVTVSMWVYGDAANTAARQIAFHGSTVVGLGHILALNLPWTDEGIVFESGHLDNPLPGWPSWFYGWEETVWLNPENDEYLGKWNHMAMTKDNGAGTQKIYLNGVLVADNVQLNVSAGGPTTGVDSAPAVRSMAGIAYFAIGCFDKAGIGSQSLFYNGAMDEFMVYDRALSHAEIVFLAKGAGTATLPVDSDANIDDANEEVDLDDLKALAASWLEVLTIE